MKADRRRTGYIELLRIVAVVTLIVGSLVIAVAWLSTLLAGTG